MQLIENSTVRSSLIVGFFTSLAGALNYLSLLLLAFSFGAGMEMDAFFAAFTIPQILTAILLATVSTTFIPLFVKTATISAESAWRVASIAANLIFVLLVSLSGLCFIWSTEIISLINPGFSGATLDLASDLFRVLMVSQVFSGTSVLLTSIYYARKRFFRASLAQCLSSFMALFFVLSFRSSWGVMSIVFGTLAGAFVQFLLLVPILTKEKRYSTSLDLRNKEIVRWGLLILPLFLGTLFYKSIVLVERLLASNLGESTISFLGYANKIVMALVLITTQGISTAVFPKMSEYAARKEYSQLKVVLSKTIRGLILIAVPITASIIIGRIQIIRLIYERGSFLPQDTGAVANALLAYLGFYFVAVIALPIVNTLYSLQETLKVAVIGVCGFCVYVALSILLSGYFSYIGIALAVSIQYVLNLGIFSAVVIHRIGKLEVRPIAICLSKSVLAAVLSSFLVVVLSSTWGGIFLESFGVIVLGILGFMAYSGILVVMRTKELKYLFPNLPLFKNIV